MLDPQARALIDLMVERRVPAVHTLSPGEARSFYRDRRAFTQPEPPPVHEVRDLSMTGPGGTVAFRLFRPAPAGGSGALPLLVYFHGGGWTIGDLDTHDVLCRQLALAGGCAVLSVDYRLAPEHPFPAAVTDARTAWEYAISKSPDWGIDPHRVVVAGDSAGGTLSAVLCQELRGEPVQPLLQVLIYPALDLSSEHPSWREFAHQPMLSAKQLRWYYGHYLEDGTDVHDPRVSPLLMQDLTGLPPAVVSVAGFDPLRDEGVAYAERLTDAGVPTQLLRESGLVHAYIWFTGISKASREATTRLSRAIAAAVESDPAGG